MQAYFGLHIAVFCILMVLGSLLSIIGFIVALVVFLVFMLVCHHVFRAKVGSRGK